VVTKFTSLLQSETKSQLPPVFADENPTARLTFQKMRIYAVLVEFASQRGLPHQTNGGLIVW
jgi:hypothetical protein